MIWQCLECKKLYSTAIIEEEGKCPNCGCCDFGIHLSDKEKKEFGLNGKNRRN